MQEPAMNDRALSPLHQKLFSVKPNQTTVETESFGMVTLTAPNVKRFRELTATIETENPERFGYELLSEMATGANGERFTADLITSLPVHVMVDIKTLLDAATLLTGHTPHEVKKDSRTR
jgi:hypothetical protein